VRVLGAGEGHTHWNITEMPSLTTWAGEISGREAFGMAGVGPGDVDVFQPYDAFTIVPVIAVEDLGFCAKGEGGDFVSDGRLAPGGALPSMTSGGGLSYNHPGALGVLLLVEQVRQLRGEAGERQVEGARIGVVHGVGGLLSVGSTVVLASA
jgi:acetyl-CoA acetyltransferase